MSDLPEFKLGPLEVMPLNGGDRELLIVTMKCLCAALEWHQLEIARACLEMAHRTENPQRAVLFKAE